MGSLLRVTDATGVVSVKCIKVFGHSKKRIAKLGDVVLVSVKRINPKKFENVKLFKRKKFFKGTLHRALIIRSAVNYSRTSGHYIRFDENDVVLVIKELYQFVIKFMDLF